MPQNAKPITLPVDTPWPEADVKRLRLLFGQGWSYGRIARKLRRTRNQVIGKAHRLGLPTPVSGERLAKDNAIIGRIINIRRRQAAGREAIARYVEPETATAVGEVLKFAKLTETSCRWPIGEPGKPEFGFCGCEKVRGSSYCAQHFQIAYTPDPLLADEDELPIAA